MADKTNDEKLKILQERLAQIKQKNEQPNSIKDIKQKTNINLDANDTEVNTEKSEKKSSFYWIRNVGILCVIILGVMYVYTNRDKLMPVSTSNENKEIITNIETEEEVLVVEEEIVEEVVNTLNLEYNFNNFSQKGHYIVIIEEELKEENTAKLKKNSLQVKGFEADYFQINEYINTDKEYYKVFIGPYYNIREAHQWKNNTHPLYHHLEQSWPYTCNRESARNNLTANHLLLLNM